jgi:hypothetical protein
MNTKPPQQFLRPDAVEVDIHIFTVLIALYKKCFPPESEHQTTRDERNLISVKMKDALPANHQYGAILIQSILFPHNLRVGFQNEAGNRQSM